jgi:hypothetical protein
MSYCWYIVPLTYFINQNSYFGWNRLPKSDAELIADGITLLLIVLVAIGTKCAKGGAA